MVVGNGTRPKEDHPRRQQRSPLLISAGYPGEKRSGIGQVIMYRVLLPAFVLGVTIAVPASAANNLVVQRPPAVLSPDLTEPWVMQLRRGNQPVVTFPKARATRTSLFAPGTNKLAPKAVQRARSINPKFLPSVVRYTGTENPGTVVIDTEARYLYLVEGNGVARRYGVGVGRPGFEWAGAHTITRKAEWPDWVPPDEMRERRPDLPLHMAGGPDNPLGARAMYLGSTLYRIHGSNEPWSIGQAVSSGCIRMRNEDVMDLYERVKVGTRVIVL
jgi:lipoprotein-anchoring transpeptidase ErfK/SrfK